MANLSIMKRALKDYSESEKYREEGNRKFKEKRYFAALAKYNLALIFGRSHPDRKALCYANRSAVYLKLEYYKHCLHNIELAEEHYPKDKIQKLLERKQICENLMKTEIEWACPWIGYTFKLSYPANPKLPFFIDAIQLKVNKTFGKHLITTRDLKAGDVIASIESWRLPINNPSEEFYLGCYNCHKVNNGDLIPGGCGVLFCSSQCENEHLENDKHHVIIHELERNGSKGVNTMFDLNLAHTARLMLSFHDSFGCVKNMYEFYETHKNKQATVFDFDWSAGRNDPEYQKKMFHCVMMHRPKYANDEKMKTCVDLLMTVYQSNSFQPLNEIFIQTDKKLQKFIRDVVCQILFALSAHSDQIMLFGSKQKLAIYDHPALFLLNHSCDPNILEHFENSKNIIWTASQPISAGSQLFVCFGHETYYNNKAECIYKDTCIPCQEGWGRQFDRKRFDLLLYKRLTKLNAKHEPFGDEVKQALKVIKKSADFINKNFAGYEHDLEKRIEIAVEKEMMLGQLWTLGPPFPIGIAHSLMVANSKEKYLDHMSILF